MEKLALRTAGIVFAVIAGAHIARVMLKLPATIGTIHIPLRISAVAAMVMFALAVWMFKAAGCSCKK